MSTDATKDIIYTGDEYEDSYRVSVNRFSGTRFDGPLELLVTLVKKSKIDLCDFFVSDITKQYLEHLSALEFIDTDEAASFIEVGAILIEMKSKAILPRPPVEPENTDAEQLRQEIMRRMYNAEFEVYKGASEKMRELETLGTHYRSPDPAVGETRFILKDMTIEGLTQALQKVILKVDKRKSTAVLREIKKDRFTVEEMAVKIKATVSEREKVNFTELFEDDFTKTEIITTFQAMLELTKLLKIRLEQETNFGEIFLLKAD